MDIRTDVGTYTYIYVYIHININVNININIDIYIYVGIKVYMDICIYLSSTSTSTSTYASVYASTSATASASAPTSNSFLWSTRWDGESISHHNWPNTSESNSANTTIVHHDALVVLHIQSRCISRELRSRVLTADIPTRRQDNGRGPPGHRAHASSPPALGRAPLACPGNRQPTAASRQRTPGTRGGPHVRRA